MTHACNARCRYCQWGSPDNSSTIDSDMSRVLISSDMLKTLETNKIVISGGEPTLHPNIHDILKYYSNLVDQVTIITNGYALSRKNASALINSGATGITVSLDSTHPVESFMTRRTPPALHGQIMRNMSDVAELDHEFGINATISRITANRITVADLLEFGLKVNADFVKFQPIFDDGYVSKNSPDLLLGPDSVDALLEIASLVPAMRGPHTNPAEFWSDVATLAGGRRLSPSGCAIGSHDALLTDGALRVCYWVESSEYGMPAKMGRESYHAIASEFDEKKRHCDVGFHCFCNQGLEHVWKI